MYIILLFNEVISDLMFDNSIKTSTRQKKDRTYAESILAFLHMSQISLSLAFPKIDRKRRNNIPADIWNIEHTRSFIVNKVFLMYLLYEHIKLYGEAAKTGVDMMVLLYEAGNILMHFIDCFLLRRW